MECVARVANSGLDVYAHNIETVEALSAYVRDPRAKFRQSISVLAHAKKAKPGLLTKTSMMLGCGETEAEVIHAMDGKRKLFAPAFIPLLIGRDRMAPFSN